MDALLLNDVTDRLWRRFVEGQLPPRVVNPIIDRWRRVRRLGLSPTGPSAPEVVTAQELVAFADESDELLAAARPVFEQNAQLFAEHDFVLLLADARGVVLLRTAGGEFEPEADAARLIAGAKWSESSRGTNAIGTALVEECPVGVVGAAHYARPNHGLACYASPIRAPGGRIVGVVDATSRREAKSRIVTLAVCGVAQVIEADLRLRSRRTELASLQPLVDRIAEPALIVGTDGDIAYANGPAKSWELRGEIERRLSAHSQEAKLDLDVRVEALSPSLRLVLPREGRARSARPEPFARITGHDAELKSAKAKAARFARTNLPVLLLAETGTGKELLARGIHDASPRASGPFVALNCGALSQQLLETELFGYGDGSFTGARPGGKSGKLEGAHGGTLFLDEIGEMPASVQAALLRVLEDGTFHRVGEVEGRSVDLRLICATCLDLPAMVEEGRFRSDLYFRIRGACLSLPPLRQRTDLSDLIDALLPELAAEAGRWVPELSTEARSALASHRWPGNIRELKSALQHALALADDEIRVEHLPVEPTRSTPATSREGAERRALAAALAASAGNLSEAARRLGVARTTLYRMMTRHGVRR